MLHEQGAVTFHLLGGGNGQKSNLQKPLFGERTKAHAANHFIALHQRQRAMSSIEHQPNNVIFRHFRQLFRKHFFQRHQSFQCSASAVVGNDAQREQPVVRISLCCGGRVRQCADFHFGVCGIAASSSSGGRGGSSGRRCCRSGGWWRSAFCLDRCRLNRHVTLLGWRWSGALTALALLGREDGFHVGRVFLQQLCLRVAQLAGYVGALLRQLQLQCSKIRFNHCFKV
mmetsp:Transcript_17878/g.31257  ORF Transcript_17878/g.31257 Transcript_17878/m.31257 type:complete len:228 (+) Transcript_17878:186-869(+)